jgi:2-polyprenyl-3-methyl-5-hydroxy-6-metoxy-1,4-benzoquinol methylase
MDRRGGRRRRRHGALTTPHLEVAGGLDLIARRVAQRRSYEGVRVPDVGCGLGETALLFGARAAIVTALDCSSAMLERAQQRARSAGASWTSVHADAIEIAELGLDTFRDRAVSQRAGACADGARLIATLDPTF